MKHLFSLPILLLLWLCGAEAWAHNWHPFPFGWSYYARPGEVDRPLGGSYKGKIIESLQLDSTFNSGGYTVKCRRKPNREWEDFYWDNFKQLFRNVQVSTKVDSSVVSFYNLDFNSPQFSNSNDTLRFYMTNRQVGQVGLYSRDHDSWSQTGNWTLDSCKVITVFGVTDSVRFLSMWPAAPIRWSKTFGLLDFPGSGMSLIGAPEIATGFHEPPVPSGNQVPDLGDTLHLRKEYIHVIQCPPSTPSSFGYAEDLRVTVMQYPYNGDPGKGLFKVIHSAPGESTGIEAHEIQSVDVEKGHAIGDMTPGYFYPGWIDSSGMFLRVKVWKTIIDGGGRYTWISPCSYSPYPISSSASGLCQFWNPDYWYLLQYPVYYRSSPVCTYGKPMGPVVVTGIETAEARKTVRLYPNPGKTLRYQGEAGTLELTDGLGRTVFLQALSGEEDVDVSALPSGLYHYRVRFPDGNRDMGNWVKE